MAWTGETEAAAKVICQQLRSCGFKSTWMSHQIPAGSRFRDEIRRSICDADLVIAVLPREPSRWLTAEAGLAYFEEKLLPIAIDEDNIGEPFSELQTHMVAGKDVQAGSGPSIKELIGLVEGKLGFAPGSLLVAMVVRFFNTSFFYGIPLFGLGIVSVALVFILISHPEFKAGTQPDLALHLLKAAHTVLGAIVYGGASFIALVFAHASTTRSLAGRHFGFSTAQRIFALWLFVAVIQFIVGLFLLDVSPYERGDFWIFASILLYMLAMYTWLIGFLFHLNSYKADEQGRSFGSGDHWALLGNVAFSIGLLLLTAVIVFMSMLDTSA